MWPAGFALAQGKDKGDKAADKSAAQRLEQAKAFVTALSKEEFARASEQFNEGLTKALGKDGVGPVWKKIVASLGPLRKHGEPRAAGSAVLIAVEFGKGGFDLRVAFDKDDRIGGFFLVPGKDSFKFPPPPYAPADSRRERSVTVNAGGDWPLPGTLTLPAGAGPFPAVVLVHGSGPNDRDETIGPNKPFRDLAWGLAARGVASLRYVKRPREHGAKMVAKGAITPREEVTDDALAAAALLRKSDKIDPKRVFLLGHSLGAYLAPMVAAADPDVAGLILLAGNTRPLEDLVVEQYAYIYSLKGELTADDKKALQEIRDKSRRVKDPKLTADVPARELALSLPAAYWLALCVLRPGGRRRQTEPAHAHPARRARLPGHPGRPGRLEEGPRGQEERHHQDLRQPQPPVHGRQGQGHPGRLLPRRPRRQGGHRRRQRVGQEEALQRLAHRLRARRDDADRPADVRQVLLLVLDAQRLADRGQQLRHRHRAVLDGRPVGPGVADHLAALDAAAGQDRAERVGPVVAAVGPRELRRPAELAHPDDQGRVQQARAPSGRPSARPSRRRPSGSGRGRRRRCRPCVSQPSSVTSTNGTPALDQPARQQAALAEQVAAVGVAQRRASPGSGRTPCPRACA